MFNKISDLIPYELLQICISIISQTHKKIGFKELPNLLTRKRNMVTLALISEAEISMGSIKRINKLQKGLWFFIILSIICSLFINLWLLSIPALLYIIIKRISITENKHWILLASIILGLEVLSINFLEWGSAYPKFMAQSKDLLNNYDNPTQLLDYYLPNRDSIDSSLLNKFSPLKNQKKV